MSNWCTNYVWRAGVPRRCGILEEKEALATPLAYRIISDPYHKRYSVERYKAGSFDAVVYDSLLLDFRHLTPAKQMAWRKETVQQSGNKTHCLLRDQNDRIVYIEINSFEKGLCRRCQVYSPQKQLLSNHYMHYRCLGDLANGVTLCDLEQRVVMYKLYKADDAGLFTQVTHEEWDLTDPTKVATLFTRPPHGPPLT